MKRLKVIVTYEDAEVNSEGKLVTSGGRQELAWEYEINGIWTIGNELHFAQ